MLYLFVDFMSLHINNNIISIIVVCDLNLGLGFKMLPESRPKIC